MSGERWRMKNAIKVGKFLQMLQDSTWESDYPQLYEKYYRQIAALLSGFNDCTLEGLSSLEGLTDSANFASFLRCDTLGEESEDSKERTVDNRFSAILADIKTWHDNEVKRLHNNSATVKQAIRDDANSKRVTLVSGIVSGIFTAAFGPLAYLLGMSYDEIAFYITGLVPIIPLVIALFAGIYNGVQNKKFHRTYGCSIANAKRLIITEEEYKAEIKQARQLRLVKHHSGNIRKAKRIYNKLLKRNSTDPNCFVGLLALLSDNFTKYSSRHKEDNLIEDIEASKGDDNYSRLDADYKEDYKKYTDEKVNPYKQRQKQNQTRKKEQHRERVAHAISVGQQLGICAVLLLPTLFSIAVLVLVYCLPVKTFDDWTGWLFTISFALDCLSVIAVIVLWIVLAVADRNPDFSGFGAGPFGIVAAVFGICGGNVIIISIDMPHWLPILMTVVCLAIWLTSLIWGLVDTDTCKRRLLLVCICSVLFGCALRSGGWTFSEFESYYTENPDGTYTYLVWDENVEILQIPSEYQGKPVTAISRADNVDLLHLKSVFIPESVTSIEFGTFSGCSALTNITVPYVGYYDISGVNGYEGEAEALRPIGYLFGTSPYSGGVATEQEHCWGKYLSGDKAGEESEFFNTYYIPESLKHVTVLGGEVCNGAFYGCTNLESVTLGAGVTAIGKHAFQDCTSLVSVAIGEGVTGIGEDAFLNCSGLTSIYIPESVTSIEFGTFSGCGALTNITVPYVGYYDIAGVKDYEGEAEALRPIGYLFGTSPYSGGVATEQEHCWGKYLSGDKAGEESEFFNTYYIPESLKHVTVLGGEVCNGAFYGCTNLESVTLGDDVTAIGEHAFQDCTSLVSVAIGDGVTGIGKDAFLNCNAVQKNKGILYVGHWVVGCDNTVTEAELSNDATGIANYAFADFASLTSVILNEKLKIIGEGVFQGTGITTMVIPQSVAVIGANAFSGCKLSEVVFDNVDEWYADKTYVPYSDLLDATKAANCLTSTYVECVWKRG